MSLTEELEDLKDRFRRVRFRRVDVLDFFPNTHHFESVARLTRGALDPPLDSGPR